MICRNGRPSCLYVAWPAAWLIAKETVGQKTTSRFFHHAPLFSGASERIALRMRG